MNYQLGELEFRLNYSMDGSRPEIVRIVKRSPGNESCYTILFYTLDKEGYYIEFVGDRPLAQDINQDDLFELMKFWQKMCNALYEMDKYCPT